MDTDIAMIDEPNLPYQVILDVEEEKYFSQVKDLVGLFKNDVDKDGKLNIEKALDSIKAMPELAILGTNTASYKQTRKALHALVKGIADTALSAGICSSFGSDENIAKVLISIFGNIQKQEGKPWFNIMPCTGNRIGETFFTYNLLYISHSPAMGSILSMTLLSCSVTIDASIKDLLGHDVGEADQKVDSNSSSSVYGMQHSPDDIKYEKYQVETELKGVNFVKQVI